MATGLFNIEQYSCMQEIDFESPLNSLVWLSGGGISDHITQQSLDKKSFYDNANALNLQDINGVNQAPSGEIYFSADGAIFASLFVANIN